MCGLREQLSLFLAVCRGGITTKEMLAEARGAAQHPTATRTRAAPQRTLARVHSAEGVALPWRDRSVWSQCFEVTRNSMQGSEQKD